MNYPHTITGVIFDSDGTIVDTVGSYFSVMERMVNDKFSKEFVESMNGIKDIEVAQKLTQKYNLNKTPEEFLQEREMLIKPLLEECTLVQGIERIIWKIHEMGIPMAIATSSQRVRFELKFSKHQDIFNLMTHTITGDEVQTTKPDPTIFLQAAKKLGDLDPQNVLVFEDAINGALAAERAGMPCVLLNGRGINMEEMLKKYNCKKPALVLNSFDEFDIGSFNFEAKIHQ